MGYRFPRTGLIVSLGMLSGCAATPMGPTVQVMPDPNKPFQVFQQDQESCKQYAQSQVQGQADVANRNAVGGALLATGLGAALGAAVGGGNGAGIGAASGAAVGAGGGTAYSQGAQGSIQQQYDNAYMQCMYSKGNQVPGAPPQSGPPPQ
jgi:uncharacterized protein YcfJ